MVDSVEHSLDTTRLESHLRRDLIRALTPRESIESLLDDRDLPLGIPACTACLIVSRAVLPARTAFILAPLTKG